MISSITLPATLRTTCLQRTFVVGLAVGGYATLQRLPSGWMPAAYPVKTYSTLAAAQADIRARVERDRDLKEIGR